MADYNFEHLRPVGARGASESNRAAQRGSLVGSSAIARSWDEAFARIGGHDYVDPTRPDAATRAAVSMRRARPR